MLASRVWREGYRWAIIDASPMRPGRGRRRSHSKGRRLESLRAQERFEGVVAAVVEGLRNGSISPEVARQEVRQAGFESFVRVAEKREEAVEAFADFFGEGYFLWTVDQWECVPRIRFCLRSQLT